MLFQNRGENTKGHEGKTVYRIMKFHGHHCQYHMGQQNIYTQICEGPLGEPINLEHFQCPSCGVFKGQYHSEKCKEIQEKEKE